MRRGDWLPLAAILCGLGLFCGVVEAIKPGCAGRLDRAEAEIERLETALRLRAGELRVVRGQLAACEARR